MYHLIKNLEFNKLGNQNLSNKLGFVHQGLLWMKTIYQTHTNYIPQTLWVLERGFSSKRRQTRYP
jgi:hypothetical protein